MGDRVPIGTLVGLTSQLNSVDILLGTFTAASSVSRVFVRHTDYDDGGATNTAIAGNIRNATGGGGSAIAFTIANQTQSGVATGSLAVAAGGSVYLRLTTGSASMNLTGWFEVTDTGTGTDTTALTNLARVKEFLGITGSTDDSLLSNLINAVSDEIQGAIGRKILETTATAERIDSAGFSRLALPHCPIVSIASLSESAVALVENTDYESKATDRAAGVLVRLSGTDVVSWARGDGAVIATYNHGYATVPEAVIQAATELVAFDYGLSAPGGKRLGLTGTVLPAGGQSSYSTRADLWRTQRQRLRAVSSVWL